ncbi:MAG: hypothetical protein GX434_09430, partial [Peptococcaceae bacterium]|nr:hypothetical protein [Peptococcaceae bacterium]
MRNLNQRIITIFLCLLLSFFIFPKEIFAAVPSTPTGLTATARTYNQIGLTWDYASGATSYNIYRCTSYDGSYSYIGSESALGHIDAGLSSNTTYYYKVIAVNSDGSSALSSVAYATTYSSSLSDLTATAMSTNQIYLAWPAISGASYYILSRSTSYSGSYSIINTTTSTGYTDSGLSSGTTYYYKVEAINSSGSYIYYSSIASATASSSSSSDLTATATGSSQIYLTWPAVSGASYYILSRSTSYSGTYTTVTTTSSNTYADTGLSTGITYYYKVQAVNSSGSTIYYSSVAYATTSSSSSGDLIATATGSSQIYLSWNVISQTSYYILSRATSYSGTYSTVTTTSSTGYTDTGLSSGTTYYYKVQAVNSSGSTIYTTSIASAVTSSSSTSLQLTSDRLAGDDRYQTSQQISKSGWNSSYYAVIVSGENYPDALCSAPLAYKYSAPILLTSKDSLDTQTRDELSRLNVKSVFLIGGTRVISSNTELTILNMGISVTRIAGNDRYDTSLKIAQAIGASGQAVLANGDSFADALSIAPIAAIKGMPILLTPPNNLSSDLKQYLLNSVQITYVLGGTGAISNTIYNQLPSPQRISGTNRYETNINIIKTFSSQLNLNTCYLATGQSFPDALAGSALASLKKSPIVLVNSLLDQSTLSFIQERTGTINKVIVFGGSGVIPNSVLTSISATNSSTALTAPSNLTATVLSASQISLSWSSVSSATTYYIYRSTSYSGTYSLVTSSSSTGYTDSGLSSYTTYYYKVMAVNGSGTSDYSSVAYATTSNTGYPSVPTGLSATALGTDQIYLTWGSASLAAYYYVYKSTSYSGTYYLVTSTSSTSYTETGLSTYTTYYYKIMAVNSTGSSDYSSIVSATTTTGSVPTAPTNLSISSVGSNQLTLSWDAVSSASCYYVYRSTSSSGTYTNIGTPTPAAYTDTGLDANTTYYYKVMAYNSYGYSPYSTVVSATTTAITDVTSPQYTTTATNNTVTITLTGGTFKAAPIAASDFTFAGTNASAFAAGTFTRTSGTVVTITGLTLAGGTTNTVLVKAATQATQASSVTAVASTAITDVNSPAFTTTSANNTVTITLTGG